MVDTYSKYTTNFHNNTLTRKKLSPIYSPPTSPTKFVPKSPVKITPNETVNSPTDTCNLTNDNDIINYKRTLNNIILNLKIIAKLKPGYKLCIINNLNVYINTSYIQYIYRLFSDNSRERTLNFL